MAVALRIDRVQALGDGRVELRFTSGRAPLPATWQGQAFVFQSKDDVEELLERAAPSDWLTVDLALKIIVSIWKAHDATLSNVNLVVGKTLTFDPAQNVNVMAVSS